MELEPISAQERSVLAVFFYSIQEAPPYNGALTVAVKGYDAPAGLPSRFLTYYFASIFLRQKGPFFILGFPPLILREHLKELRHSIFTPAPRRHMVVRVIWVQKRFFRRLINAAPTGGSYVRDVHANAHMYAHF